MNGGAQTTRSGRRDRFHQPTSVTDHNSRWERLGRAAIHTETTDTETTMTTTLTMPKPRWSGAGPHLQRTLDFCAKQGLTATQTAYVAATFDHESVMGRYMKELRSEASAERKYGYRTPKGRTLGNTAPGDGARYMGRGYVQLTGKNNYRYWSNRLSRPLLQHPELASDPDLAVVIGVVGMQEGRFTGVGLDRYINDTKTDFHNARRTVNGTDKAAAIAARAVAYHRALTAQSGPGGGGGTRTPAGRDQVRHVQEQLRRIGFKLDVDGIEGPQTRTMVTRFQEGYLFSPLAIDGIAGPLTIAALAECVARNGRTSDHFRFAEFATRNTGEIRVRRELVAALERLRDHIGKPLSLISAYRDPAHNAKVGGAKRSRHLYGEAADITSAYRLKPHQVAQLGVFSGIGHRAGWVVHLDVRGVPAGSPPAGRATPANPEIFPE